MENRKEFKKNRKPGPTIPSPGPSRFPSPPVWATARPTSASASPWLSLTRARVTLACGPRRSAPATSLHARSFGHRLVGPICRINLLGSQRSPASAAQIPSAVFVGRVLGSSGDLAWWLGVGHLPMRINADPAATLSYSIESRASPPGDSESPTRRRLSFWRLVWDLRVHVRELLQPQTDRRRRGLVEIPHRCWGTPSIR